MGEDSCHVHFGIQGRFAVINGIGEGLIPPKLARLDKNNPVVPEPPSNGLPKWHAKLDPTQALLNSFILPEDSPEVKKYFQ